LPATSRAVDFTNVKDAGQFNPRRLPAGDYRAKIAAVDDHTSQNSKSNQPDNWVFTIVPTSSSRATYPYYCGFDEKQAWKIRNLCIAAGIEVPKRRVKVDPNKLVGKEIGISLDDDEYEGREKSTVVAVFPEDELAEDAPGASKSKASSGKGSSRSKATDDDDDVSADDAEELDLEEI
jgi:hypothetical protein